MTPKQRAKRLAEIRKRQEEISLDQHEARRRASFTAVLKAHSMLVALDAEAANLQAAAPIELSRDDRERVWYRDFLDFLKSEQVFARLLTPAAYGGGDPDVRWDTFRNCEFNEITAFYALHYWYTWQVTILGLGPLWMTDNAASKTKTAL